MRRTRIIPLAFLSMVLVLAFMGGCRNKATELKEGMPAPLFTLKDVNGAQVNLADLKGSVVIVNFWATWCPPCKDEMPSLERLFELMMKEQKLVIVSVLYRDEPQRAVKFSKENGLGFPVLLDPNLEAANAYGLTGVPETYVIDKKGILQRKIIGPTEFDNPDAVEFIKGLLAK